MHARLVFSVRAGVAHKEVTRKNMLKYRDI
jgi:hypothetical protein